MSPVSAARTGQALLAAAHVVPSRPRRVAATVVSALALDELFDPVRTHVPLCPLHAWTGLWCPFCGGLRSAFELTRLHFSAAWHDNALLVAALPLLAVWWVESIVRDRTGQPPRRLAASTGAVIVVALIGFTVIRNLPLGAILRGDG